MARQSTYIKESLNWPVLKLKCVVDVTVKYYGFEVDPNGILEPQKSTVPFEKNQVRTLHTYSG